MRHKATFFTFAVLVTLLHEPNVLLAQSEKASTCPDAPVIVSRSRHGRWLVLETENFQVCSDGSATNATGLARRAEALRSALRSKWLGRSSGGSWNPRCQIVLHRKRESYAAAVGRGSERSVGSSLVEVDDGQIVGRRIDLLADQTQFRSAALPHELTHIVLRERFASTAPPRWADEGAAILADPQTKQARHSNDLTKALARQDLFRIGELLTMDEYPRPDRMGAFYGQSAALAQFLVERVDADRFVKFIECAMIEGYDAALRKCYGIGGVSELDLQWRQHVYQANASGSAG